MKRLHEQRKGQKGFTLIEIIAVLVILGVLAAVAVPRYFALTRDANTAAINAAGAEIQARINQRFGQQLIVANGDCGTALGAVTIASITDADGSIGGWTVTGTGWTDTALAGGTGAAITATLTNVRDATITGDYDNLHSPTCK